MNAIKENNYIKELYLAETKLMSTDGIYLGGFLKENRTLEILDLRSNQLNVIVYFKHDQFLIIFNLRILAYHIFAVV